MEVFVSDPNQGRESILTITPNMTGGDLIRLAADEIGIDEIRFNITYQGNIVKRRCRLTDLGVMGGESFEICRSYKPEILSLRKGRKLSDLPSWAADSYLIVKEAVSCRGGDLQFASMALRDDPVIVRRAVESTGSAFRFASDRLKSDKDFVMSLLNEIEGFAKAFSMFPTPLSDDRDIFLIAVQHGSMALDRSSPRIRDDEEIVRLSVSKFSWSLRCASHRLRNSLPIVRIACSIDKQAFYYASDEIRDYFLGFLTPPVSPPPLGFTLD